MEIETLNKACELSRICLNCTSFLATTQYLKSAIALEQSILNLLFFAAQLLIPGAATVFKLLANRWYR